MSQPVRTSGLQKTHATLWYDFASYRLAWTVLPQALIALVFAVFIMGGGLSDFSFGGAADMAQNAKGDWGKPMDLKDVGAELDKLRDAVSDHNDPDSLAVLEDMATKGNAMAALKLAELYDPMQAGYFPNPAQKDAPRALEMFQIAADAEILSAMIGVTNLRLSPETPTYDAAKGCHMVKSLVKKLLDGSFKLEDSDAWYLIQAANCLTGLIRPKEGPPPNIGSDDAQKAIDLYKHPLVAQFSDAEMGLAHLYLAYASPVSDVPQGCVNARKWIDREGILPERLKAVPATFLVEVGYCLLGTDGYRTSEKYAPSAIDEKSTYTLWSLPSFADDTNLAQNLAWFDLNSSNQTGIVARGCDTAQRWADLSGGDEAEFDALTDWLSVRISKCLIGRLENTGATPLTPKQREIGLKMLERRAATKTDPNAMIELGFVYEGGVEGVPIDLNRARTLYQDCAAVGGLADCNANIGRFKRYGMGGLAVDLESAVADFTICADAGIFECHAQLVDTWDDQNSPRLQNFSSVLSHLEAAADGGDAYGLWLYGLAIYNGDYGLQSDKEASAVWLIKAIDASFGAKYAESLRNSIGPQIKNKSFWKSFHQELRRRSVYAGEIYDHPTDESYAAVLKLAD